MSIYLLLALLAAAAGAATWVVRRRRAAAPAAAPPSPRDGEALPDGDLIGYANALSAFFEASAHPKDLLAHEPFAAAAAAIGVGSRATPDLLAYAAGSNSIVACLALEAIGARKDEHDVVDLLLALLDRHGWRAYFALRALHARATGPLVGRVLGRVDDSWVDPLPLGWLAEFLAWRTAANEPMTWSGMLETLDTEKRTTLDTLVVALGNALPASLRDEYAAWQRDRVDSAYLRSVGRIRGDDGDIDREIIDHPILLRTVDEVESVVCGGTPRPVVLVGEPGVGKSTVLARVVQRLRRSAWIVFDTSASELLAGQSYIGQLEDRVLRVVRETAGKNVVWLIRGGFHELLYAGQTVQSPAGIIDLIFPYLEAGSLRLVGETQPAAYETLLQQRPRLRTVLKPIRIAPLSADTTYALARQWAMADTAGAGTDARTAPRITEAVLQEAHQLAAQHLGDRASPGALLHFLQLADERVRARAGQSGITLDDLLLTLTSLTGLPLDVLDDRIALDLDRLRSFFAARVLGQDEAVDALVERVALVKAGLTDPTRPAGVFLFVGPTGTGKTELARALADYLFGSPERMIRLDMSEFQDPAMLGRLLGNRADAAPSGTSLVDEVRKQPFSVVLLDEFEKAHPRVWDLFLQLFDDGRLTDQSGNTAWFRHAIIIMTSNVGSKAGSGIGFGETSAAGFTAGDVQRALRETFRPEFINRIDRVVVFRPLARSIMRELLDKEIREVLRRRGLRNRPWAIEWEEPAIELLIRHGFSPTLGARPLKRAVERYLLSPLALSIVNRRIPEGDQFLLIGAAGDRLTVEFVDPDAAPATEVEEGAREEQAGVPALEDIVRAARGDTAELEALAAEYDHLRALIGGVAWQERKRAALASIARRDFWESPDRFGVLGLAEYMDRVEVGLDTAGSLLGRLNGRARAEGGRFPPDLGRRLAQQLYLVGEAIEGIEAGTPRDAFVRIRAADDPGAVPGLAADFARRIARMYVRWAEQRRMRCDVVDERATGDAPHTTVLAISGFAAYRILAPERGQHVLEAPAQNKAFTRARALVEVVPQPDEPPSGSKTLLAQALGALDAVSTERPAVVRRYREEPSPLVRDAVRGWRTGRLDDVLDGDFDLMG